MKKTIAAVDDFICCHHKVSVPTVWLPSLNQSFICLKAKVLRDNKPLGGLGYICCEGNAPAEMDKNKF